MTGPEHYKRAEDLLQEAKKARASIGGALPQAIAETLATAQVHAALALADAMYAVAGRTGGE